MKRVTIIMVAALLAAGPLAACGASTQGPVTWIDQPLNGTHFPLGTLTLQAHASDGDGVAAIQFYIGGGSLQSVSAGGARLGEALIEWTPPGPGIYDIAASAVDGKGNAGPRATVQITVGDVTLTATPTAFIEPGTTPTPAPNVTPLPGGPALTLSMNANCRHGPGTAYEAVDAFLQGQVLTIDGRNEGNSWFWVRTPGGSSHCWVSSIVGTASGNWSGVPLVAAPPRPITVTPPPPAVDNTPPRISNVSVNPTSLHKDGCGAPTTSTIEARVTDDGGVAQVAFTMQGPNPGDAISGSLSPVGGGVYQAQVGPFQSLGNWSISLSAVDTSNNSTQAGPWTIQVMCIQ